MSAADRSPLLVTGAHRTGTTWVGRLLSAAPGMAYISEPLNVWHRPGVLRVPVRHWYTYICDENQDAYIASFQELLHFQYHLLAEIASLRSLRDVGRMGRDWAVFTNARLRGSIPVLKDPFAVFSLDWFARALGCRIVVTVRHPAAFASGLKRLNWSFNFGDLLGQPLLMRDHLEPYRAEMQSDQVQDVVGQAGLLWKIIYGTLVQARIKVQDIHVLKHEDLAQEPITRFQALFELLGLDFTPRARSVVLDSSSARNPAELSRRSTHAVRMDSRASLQNWKRRLSPDEVARVRRLTEGVSESYYGEESWN